MPEQPNTAPTIQHRPVELLQQLLRFDTTNPPGNEAACIAYIDRLLQEAGCTTRILAQNAARPNLIARLPGLGTAPPLLLYGHVDVVTTVGQDWAHPPFAGTIADGFLWGRGALDMKGGVAMMLAAFLRTAVDGPTPPGDLILCILSDEEDGGNDGARFLVREYPELFAGVRHAVGEFGGFSIRIGGKKFYPIQVAEKQACRLRAFIHGPGGHGSLIHRGGAAARLGRMLEVLDRRRLPVHITQAAREMIRHLASALGFPAGLPLRGLLSPPLTSPLLRLLGKAGVPFEPLLRNTVNATVIQGGEKINVVPSLITVDMDGRILPGMTPDDLVDELHHLVGPDIEFRITAFDPGPGPPDMSLFGTLRTILRERDPEGTAIPLFLSAVTDGRFLARLGIQTYGFLPMPLPADFDFSRTIHAADERIPIEALEFGTEAISTLLYRYGTH